MITFWDTDVLLKLSAMDLLDETLGVLQVDSTSVYVAPSASYYVHKKRNLQQRYGATGLERAQRFVNTVRTISIYDESALQALSQVNDIETGEAVLIASALLEEDFLLLTGDKRALQALAQAQACVAIVAHLHGRVVCLEQIVLKLAQQDFRSVLAKVVPARGCDTAIKVAFGSGLQASYEAVAHALQEYIEELRNQTSGMLIDW